MRRWGVLAGLLALGALLFFGLSQRTPAPERAVEKLLDRLAAGKLWRAERMLLDGELPMPTSIRGKRVYKELFASLHYVVMGSEIGDDSAEVAVSITTLNMEELLAVASLELLEDDLGGAKASSSRLFALLEEKMRAEDAEQVTSTVTVSVVRTGSGWKVDIGNSGSFAEAITGGLGGFAGE